jgi:hypothetical protein
MLALVGLDWRVLGTCLARAFTCSHTSSIIHGLTDSGVDMLQLQLCKISLCMIFACLTLDMHQYLSAMSNTAQTS